MRIDHFGYYIKQASKSFRQNKLMSIASVSTTFATLFILGVFILLTLNVNAWADDFTKNCQIQVFISDSLSEAEYDTLGSEILNIENVESIEKYTKEQIFDEMRVKLKEKNQTDVLAAFEADNPFRNSYKITLSDLNETKNVATKLEKIKGIEKVSEFQDEATTLVNLVGIVKTISLWIMVILFIISAFIVANSVKVSVYARRREINIMKYIGATDWFIKWPFVIEGIIIGIYGAILCFAVIWILYALLYSKLSLPLSFGDVWSHLAVSFVLMGVVIGSLGSIFSIRKHLKV